MNPPQQPGSWAPDQIKTGTTSLLITNGLLTMMYPVLANIHYRREPVS